MARTTARPTLPQPRSCAVCGCAELLVDETPDLGSAAVPGGVLLLSECTRCAHRWTAERRARVVRVEPRRAQTSRLPHPGRNAA